MTITPKFDINKLFNEIDSKVRPALHQAVTEAFELSFAEICNQAKSLNTYKDQTHNLRDSIGYMIYDNGELVSSHFSNGGGPEGAGKGEEYCKEKAEEVCSVFPKGVVGVIVAGMHYALYVESKGYDVLTGPANNLQSVLNGNLQTVRDVFKD